MYNTLVFVAPTHTTSETPESMGASLTFPLFTSRKCQVVFDLPAVQLYLVEEKRANSYTTISVPQIIPLDCVLTPLGLTFALLRLGAASMPLKSQSPSPRRHAHYILNIECMCLLHKQGSAQDSFPHSHCSAIDSRHSGAKISG